MVHFYSVPFKSLLNVQTTCPAMLAPVTKMFNQKPDVTFVKQSLVKGNVKNITTVFEMHFPSRNAFRPKVISNTLC